MDTLLQDIRYALRTLRRTPGLTLAAVLTIALGIGVNTAVFSLANAILLRPADAADPTRLVRVYSNTHSPLQREQLDYVSARSSTLTGLFGERYLEAALNTPQGNRKVNAELVGGSYFTTVGVGASLGRVFTRADDTVAAHGAVAVVSHRWWREAFGADPSLVGRTIRINGQPITVVGVAREGFAGAFAGFGPQIWLPMSQMGPLTGTQLRDYHGSLYVGGRLRDGATKGEARAELRVLAAQLTRLDPAQREPVRLSLDGSNGVNVELRNKFGVFAVALLAVTGLVLLIACSNVANLLLARGVARRREMGVRMAVGGARGRLVRQLLTESVILSLAGAVAALLATMMLTQFVMSRVPAEIPMAIRLSPDVRVLGFALGGALLAALIFGVAPAVRTASADVISAIKEGAVAPRGARLRNTLVAAQVSLCMVLLGSSALFIRSLGAAGSIDPGFDPAHILNQSVDLRLGSYDETTGPQFYRRLQASVRNLPGVQSVSLQQSLPLQGDSRETGFVLPGEPADGPSHPTHFNIVGADYFRTMGVPLVRGRDFADADRADSPPVTIVNETFVRRYLPAGDPVGRLVSTQGPSGPFMTVVGVARDGKYVSLGEDPLPMLYQPFAQSYDPEMTLHVRAAGDPATLARAVQREVAALDPALPVPAPKTMREQLRRALLPAQLGAAILGGLGALALVLAAVGIYGVVSFAAGQRTREIGIRTALGAPRVAVVKLVMGANLRVVALGLAVGTVLAIVVGKLASGMLYGVTAADPALLLGAPAVLMSVALLASWLPARRASRVDPVVALRAE
ncbi:MAG TPA: ABC transporter permease [Longimicrobium sp.]